MLKKKEREGKWLSPLSEMCQNQHNKVVFISTQEKKRSCFILFDKLNQGENMCHSSSVCTSPKLPPHSGPILDQIDLTRSQKPGNGLASQGFHCR